jgi:NADPH:quinone reductase-like Zn-dependent oxidoreductase
MEAQSQAVNPTTRAALLRRGGPAARVRFHKEIQPVGPGPGEVKVRVAVFFINPTDWKERSSGTTLKHHDVKVPNQDGAGTIEAVGEGVALARVGERLCLYLAAWKRQYRTAAELCTLPAEPALALPDVAPADLGASLGIPALTADPGCRRAGRWTTAALPSPAARVPSATPRSKTGAVGKVLVDVSPAARSRRRV